MRGKGTFALLSFYTGELQLPPTLPPPHKRVPGNHRYIKWTGIQFHYYKSFSYPMNWQAQVHRITHRLLGKHILVKGYTICSLLQSQYREAFTFPFLQENLHTIYWDLYDWNPLLCCHTAKQDKGVELPTEILMSSLRRKPTLYPLLWLLAHY